MPVHNACQDLGKRSATQPCFSRLLQKPYELAPVCHVIARQATVAHLRVSLAAAEARLTEDGEAQMQRVSAALDAQLAALQGRLGILRDDVAAEVCSGVHK